MVTRIRSEKDTDVVTANDRSGVILDLPMLRHDRHDIVCKWLKLRNQSDGSVQGCDVHDQASLGVNLIIVQLIAIVQDTADGGTVIGSDLEMQSSATLDLAIRHCPHDPSRALHFRMNKEGVLRQ